MKLTFLKKGLRELWSHKVQYLLLIIVLGLGVAMYSAFNDFAVMRWNGLQDNYGAARYMDIQVNIQYGETLNETEMKEMIQETSLSEMIEDYEMRLSYDVFVNFTDGGETRTRKGMVIGYHALDPAGNARDVTVNRPLFYVDDPDAFTASDSDQCYIERKFALAYGIGSGEKIEIRKGVNSLEAEVLEQVAVPNFFFVIREGDLFPSERSFGIVLLPMASAQALYSGLSNSTPVVNEVVFRLREDVEREKFENMIQSELEEKGVVVKITEKEENPSRYFLFSDYENDKESMAIFPIVIFGVSAFGLVMALRRMIRTHRPQIGIFKALGIPNSTVMVYFGIIGITIAILGTFMGWILSLPLNYAFLSLAENLLGFPIMEYQISYIYYVYGGMISIALCLSCTLIPAAVALRIKPIDAIQKREGMTKKKVGVIPRVLGQMGVLPVSLKMTVRNLLRKPGRSLSTALGVALSLALFLSYVIILESAMDALDSTTEGMDWDYEVTLDGFSPVNITSTIEERFREIQNINPGITLPIELKEGDDPQGGLIYAVDEVNRSFSIDLESGELVEGGMIISKYNSEELGLKVGDMMYFQVPFFTPPSRFQIKEVGIEIVGVHKNHMGHVLFMDLGSMQELTNLTGMANTIYLEVEGGGPSRSLENGLITTGGIKTVTHIRERENLLEQYSDLLVQVVFVMAVISIALAGAIVYTIFKINSQEKERDYATMKTLGTSLSKLGKLIFLEAGYVTASGLVLGSLMGWGLAWLMLYNAIEEWGSMNITLSFSWNGFFIGASMIVGVVLVVSILTIRYISRINIADVIRDRSTG